MNGRIDMRGEVTVNRHFCPHSVSSPQKGDLAVCDRP